MGVQMNAITLSEAKQDLESLIDRVLSESEPTVVSTEGGDIVLLSLDEFNAWKETIYLLSSPANAAHLKKSLDEASAGRVKEKELIET
jgi:antitoxin YefM